MSGRSMYRPAALLFAILTLGVAACGEESSQAIVVAVASGTPSSTPTLTPEWKFHHVIVEGTRVMVELKVHASVVVVVTLSGRASDEVSYQDGIQSHVFDGVPVGQYTVLAEDAMGNSLAREVEVVPLADPLTSEPVPPTIPTHIPVSGVASTPANTPTATPSPKPRPNMIRRPALTPTPTHIPTPAPTNTPMPTPAAEVDTATRTLPSVGICDRSRHVRDAILDRIDGVDDCGEVTAAHLVTIDGRIHPAGGEHAAEFQPGDFHGLAALEVLDLRGAGFTSLEAGVFDGLNSLVVLDLRGTWYISYPDWLGSVHRNSLESLDEGLFMGLSSLRKLYLGDGHQLTSLEVGTFDELSALEFLYLSGNQLTSLEVGIFDELSALEFLYLSGNQLTSLDAGVFDSLTSLTELKLSYVGETSPPRGLFDRLNSLRELRVATGLASLEAGALAGFPITHLDVSANTSILPGGLFSGLTSVKVLDLSGHFHFPPARLTTLEAGAFEGLDSLKELNLYHNRLATLETGAFDGLPSLASIDLSGNELALLEVGVFRALRSLTSLDLSFNELTVLEAGVFGDLTNLDKLSLHGNPLTRIDNSVFAGPTKLGRLELPLTIDVPSPDSGEEWICQETQRFLKCSLRTGNRR